ncbi:MAG: ABC transporter ATP-binding protein/permease [Pirellula sp.]|jgi:ATP-binding cassette subfamily B protein/subfamily B ATP-binding cassette protein MsbA|nr:ABC transporter ATP-binding protein/permease [Pirellula sp.]
MPSSRTLFTEYLKQLRASRRSSGASGKGRQEYDSYHSTLSRSEKDSLVSRSHRSFWLLFREFWRLLAGHRGRVLFGLATLTISTLLGLIPPLGTKWAIDSALTTPPVPLPTWASERFGEPSRFEILVWIAIAVALVTLVRTTIHLWGRWECTKAVNQVQTSVRKKSFEHMLELPLHKVQQLKSGGATSMLREDAGGISDLIFSMLYNPWQAIVQLLGSLVVLVLVDWRLLAAGLLLLPAVYFSHRTWIYAIRPLYRDLRATRQRIDASSTETFSGIRVVRTFARQRSETQRYVRGNHYSVRQTLLVWWRTRLIEIVWEVLIPLCSTLLLVYGGWQILQGDLTLGDLMMFLVYLTMLLGPIATLAGSAVQFQNNLAGLDRVLDLLGSETEHDVAASIGDPNKVRVDASKVRGEIEFQNVSFRYPESESWVLKDIDFMAHPGTTIAIVGRSGAGKTTLCNLVARFFEPTGGRILLDGRPLCDIELQSYRELLGMVEQEVFLFDGSIAENIAYGRPNAGRDAIERAAIAAAAHDFIVQSPQGYETLIGERGFKLSGGQRQRIAIARAILADPKILILDEATSNLDSESEQLIQESLSKLLRHRTSFVIAHRLSTIKNADLILVMDQGKIVQTGTHQDLLARPGLYQQMVRLQTENPIAVACDE